MSKQWHRYNAKPRILRAVSRVTPSYCTFAHAATVKNNQIKIKYPIACTTCRQSLQISLRSRVALRWHAGGHGARRDSILYLREFAQQSHVIKTRHAENLT
jgi:hypothetical protein